MAGELGVFLRNRRKQLGLTQERVAAAAQISRAHLSQIESGKIALPNAATRRLLARVLSVDHVDLLVAAGELRLDEVKPKDRAPGLAWMDMLNEIQPAALAALFEIARHLAHSDPPVPATSPHRRD